MKVMTEHYHSPTCKEMIYKPHPICATSTKQNVTLESLEEEESEFDW